MIYSVHFYYRKINSCKAISKCEAYVFANSRDRAEDLIKEMISGYDIETESLSVVNVTLDRTLDEIYNTYPELIGVKPQDGKIIDEYMQRMRISRYLNR